MHVDPADFRTRDEPLQRPRDRVLVQRSTEATVPAILMLACLREDQAMFLVLQPVREFQLGLLALVPSCTSPRQTSESQLS